MVSATTSSGSSSIVSAFGGGSGVDMQKLASDLAEARFLTQKTQLESRGELLDARISGASTLKNQLSQLASALGDRIRNGDLAPSAVVGNAAVAQASVLPGGVGVGSYSLEVNHLAAAQTLASKPFGAATDLVGEGQLTITFGNFNGTTALTPDSRAPVNIAISATDTLADVATKIRTSGAGLNAYVAQTPTGAKLVVKGADGAANGFEITASGASVSGGSPVAGQLDYLAWSAAGDTGQRTASARDADFVFDGVPMTSASNKVTGLPGALVLTLTGENPGAATSITFADKSKQITAMMGDFVTALNEIASTVSELANPKGGDLGSDPGTRALKRALAGLTTQVVMPGAAEGEPNTLADLGLAANRDGTFRLDTARLQTTLNSNLAAAGAMFTTGLHGVYSTIDNLARSASTRGDPGSLGGSIERYTSQKAQLAEKLSDIAESQEKLREQLARQFTWADRNVATSQSTLSFIKNQVAMWTRSGN